MKQWRHIVSVAAAFVAAPIAASASVNDYASIAVHLAAPTTKNNCQAAQPLCYQVETEGLLVPNEYDAYVLAMSLADGVTGVRFGVDYDGTPTQGVEIDSWQACGDNEYPLTGWPAPGTGNSVTWSSCQIQNSGDLETGGVVTIGYFHVYAYSADELRLTANPAATLEQFQNCNTTTTTLAAYRLGWAEFSADGSVQGNNPCGYGSGQSCHLMGPDTVEEGQQGIEYAINSDEGEPYGRWMITDGDPGVAEIVGDDTGVSVQVNALAYGQFTLSYIRCPDGPEGCGACWMDVTVDVILPVNTATWGEIKARYRR